LENETRPDRAERARRIAGTLEEQGVVAVALSFVDNAGITRVKTIPAHRLPEAALEGVGMSPVFDYFLLNDHVAPEGSPVGDLRLVPDLERVTVLSAQPGWGWAPVDRYDQDGQPHPGCQRAFARKIADAAMSRGIEVRMGFEMEWTVGNEDAEGNFVPATSGPGYGMARLSELGEYVAKVHEFLARQGIRVLQVHPEYAPGQFEVSFDPSDPVGAADDVVLVRETIRALTLDHGMRPSFAPLVVAGGVGNGGHLHVGLYRDGQNFFSSGDGRYGLSAEGEAFLAALLAELPALCAVGAPSPASYGRLVPSHWAGAFACWGRENREAALRLITGSRKERGETANAEVKCFDQAANPYLVVGAVLATGLAGFDSGRRLPDEVSVDPASLDEADRHRLGIVPLPQTLSEAVDRLGDSEVLASAMGPELFKAFLAVRRAEMSAFAGTDDRALTALTRWRY
jgi:glutamine synthetase